MDRIRAVRDVGRAGYATGADVLIGLLPGESGVPKEEVVWALESISGVALGDNAGRWTAWWEGLPPHVKRPGRGDAEGQQGVAIATASPIRT